MSRSQISYTSFLSEKNEIVQAEIAYELLENYRVNDLDSLKIVSVDLIEIGERNSNQFAIATGLSGFGSYCILSGSVKPGIDNLKIALKYFEKNEDWSHVSQIFNEIGNAYLMIGEFNSAIEAYSMSLEIGELSDDETDAFSGEIGLGKAYVAIGDTTNGVSSVSSYKMKAVELNKYEAAANASSFLSTIAQDRGDLEKSLEYLEESLRYGKMYNSKLVISHGLTNKAILFIYMQKIDSSLILFEQALELRKELNRPRQIVEAYYNLSNYYMVVEDYSEAMKQANISIQIAQENQLVVDEYDALELLSEIYGELNQQEKTEEVERRMGLLKVKLEKKTDVDEELINYINEINTLEVDSTEVKNQSSSRNYLWLLLLIPVGIFFLRRKK